MFRETTSCVGSQISCRNTILHDTARMNRPKRMTLAEHHAVHFCSPANGLGMVLAEKGTLDHAKDVFARVREVSAEVLGDVWINLAHVYLAQNKHNEVSVTFHPLCRDRRPRLKQPHLACG